MTKPCPSPFTVVIPLFNKAEFIVEAIASARRQTLAPADIVVVDDESSDGGPDLISQLAPSGARLVRQLNAGPGVARNTGVATARSDWIAFLDADDLWLPSHLADLADIIASFPDADLISTGWKRTTRGEARKMAGKPAEAGQHRRIDYFAESAANELLWTSAIAVRRERFIAAGGFGEIWPGEDVELWARIALDHQVAVTTSVSALYVQGTGGAMDSGTGSRNYLSDPAAQPLIALLDRIHSEGAHPGRGAQLRRFRNETLESYAKPSIFNAKPALARSYLRAIDPTYRRRLWRLWLLARLPAIALRIGRVAYSSLRRRPDLRS